MKNISNTYSESPRDCFTSELFETLKELVNSMLYNLFQIIGKKIRKVIKTILWIQDNSDIKTWQTYKKINLKTDLSYEYRLTNESKWENVYACHLCSHSINASYIKKQAKLSRINFLASRLVGTLNSHINPSSPHFFIFYFRGRKK